MATNDRNNEHGSNNTGQLNGKAASVEGSRNVINLGKRSSSLTSDDIGPNQAYGELFQSRSYLASVHDVFRQNCALTQGRENRILNSEESEKTRYLHQPTRWQSSDDPAYPGIPFQVARYLCETSPDLLHRMQAALHSGTTQKSNGSKSTTPVVSSSSLSYMSTMADALALQESVIGNKSVTPVPLDVVCQVVQSNLNKVPSWEGVHNLPPQVTLASDFELTKGGTQILAPPLEMPGQAMTSHRAKGPLGSVMIDEAKELHPFPKERISTVVERTSWFSGGPKEEAILQKPRQPNATTGRMSDSGAGSGSANLCNFSNDDVTMSFSGHPRPSKVSQDFADTISVATSEIDSVYSERYELDSNFSERLELQSNMSEVSGIEEEMFHIRKLLVEAPNLDPINGADELRDSRVSHYVRQLDVLRERAAMEGQLEALRGELEATKRERMQLQVQLSTHQTALSSQSVLSKATTEEVDYLRRRAEDTDHRIREFEDVVEQLRAAVDMKSEEVSLLRAEAREAEAESQRLRIALQELKVDSDSRDGAVQGLKGKVAELHTELHNALQAKGSSEGELAACRNQVNSECKMKEWYRQQLQEAQALRSAIQQEVIGLQSEKGEVESTGERLRFERDQARQLLAELQQRTVREKEAMMRHLETIEADVREREAAYGQLKSTSAAGDDSEALLAAQLRKVTEERSRLNEDAFSRAELERQLETTRAEEAVRTLAIQKLEKDVAQMMKQLTVQQKIAGERDLEIHSCRGALSQLEAKNREQKLLLLAAGEREATLGRERSALDAKLLAAYDERRETDAALVDFRTSVGKLDGHLRYLKEELATKTVAVDQLRGEKTELEQAAASRDVLLEQQRKRLAAAEEETRRLGSQLRESASASTLEEELAATKEMLMRVSGDLDRLVSDNAALRERIRALTDFNVSSQTRDDLGTKLGREVTDLRRQLVDAMAQLSEARARNDRLSSEMVQLAAIRRSSSSSAGQDDGTNGTEPGSGSDLGQVDYHLSLLQNKLMEKEEASLRMSSELKSAMEELARLEEENQILKEQHLRRRAERWGDRSGDVDELGGSVPASLTFHRDDEGISEEESWAPDEQNCSRFSSRISAGVNFGTQTEEWKADVENLAACSYVDSEKLAQVETALRDNDAQFRIQQRRHESNIKVLTRKLKEVLKTRKKLEEELRQANAKLAEAVSEATRKGADVPAEMADEPTGRSEGSGRTRDAKVSYYRKRIVMMDNKLSEMQRLYDVERKRADRNQELLIEVEKQKGRLHVIAESNSNIKQHQSELEAVLLERESAISVLDLQAKNTQLRKQQEEAQLRENLKELQEKLQLEQSSNRDLKKQVFKERYEASGVKKQIASLKSGLDDASRQMEAKQKQCEGLEREVNGQKQMAAQLRGEISALQDKLLEYRTHIERLEKELEASHAKDPVLADQIKTLGWHLQKKNQEVAHQKEQCKQMEAHHQVEQRQLNENFKKSKMDLFTIKTQLQAALDEKFSYQTKLTELRTALKSSHDRNKILHAELTSHSLGINGNSSSLGDPTLLELKLPESPAPYDESLIANLLQQSLSLPKNGPLNNLHVCLNTLKQEMAILQQQLLDQTGSDS